jgi:acetyl esterase/lipase
MKDEEAGLSIPARTIPTPRTVSPEAQAFLSRGLPFAPPEISHNDKEAWRAYIAQTEKFMEPVLVARAKETPARFADHRLSSSTLYEVTPEGIAPEDSDKVLFNIHGGGFIFGRGMAAAYTALPLAGKAGLKSFAIDYRMPPDHPFPAGLDDTLEAYRFLLARYDPEKIAVEGSSAGANLAAAVILRARDEGLPLPGACVLHTAAVDISESGDTFKTNVELDVVLRKPQPNMMRLYAGDHDMRDPYLSPVFGDFSKGFPPTILVSGTRDILLSSTVMMHRALRRAGLSAELHVFEAMPHGGFGHTTPEDRELRAECARFVRERLGATSAVYCVLA